MILIILIMELVTNNIKITDTFKRSFLTTLYSTIGILSCVSIGYFYKRPRIINDIYSGKNDRNYYLILALTGSLLGIHYSLRK
jgi:hypothetical protein